MIAEFISRAASQTGFDRERFIEEKLPTNFSNLVVILFLGDARSEFILSSLILPYYLKTHCAGKYVVFCGWAGHGGLFPYVDEYWSVSDALSLRELSDKAVGFSNLDKRFEVLARNLRKYFENVLTWEDLAIYYDKGLTTNFLHQDTLRIFYPGVTSVNLELRKSISNKANKLFICPVRVGQQWYKKATTVKFQQDFWVNLCQRLLAEQITPIVYQNYATYDISPVFGDKCLYVTDRNITNVLGVMRAAGGVLDVYSGIAKLAIAAGCPFLACAQRQLYTTLKEWEIDDLTIRTPYRYIFSFPTIIESGNYKEIIDNIVYVWRQFSNKLANASQTEEFYNNVSYTKVRQHKARRVGLRFVKVDKVLWKE